MFTAHFSTTPYQIPPNMDFANSFLATRDTHTLADSEDGKVAGLLVFYIGVGIVLALFFTQLLYIFKVIFTLAAVEAAPAISLPLDTDARKAADVLGINAKPQYISSSIRGALKHLRAQAGVFSPWRGFGASIGYVFAISIVKGIFQAFLGAFLPGFIARPVTSVLSTMLLARFSLAVTHIIISRPQPTWWIKRVLATPWSSARRTLCAMAHFTLAQSVSQELCATWTTGDFNIVARIVMVLLGMIIAIFVVLPLFIALVRVQASLLPETEEAIVSFDRTFGKEEEGALSLKEAFRSVKCSGWQRLVKLAGKMVGIVTVLVAAVWLTNLATLGLVMDGVGGVKV